MNNRSVLIGGQMLIVSAFLIVILIAITQQRAAAGIPYLNTIISTTSSGAQVIDATTPGNTNFASSSDGRYVLFSSMSSQLVPNDTNGKLDWFVKDTQSNAVNRVNVKNDGSQLTADTYTAASISSNGRYVSFIVANVNYQLPGNHTDNVYVRDLKNGTTTLVSQSTAGVAGNGSSWGGNINTPEISADGRYIVFTSNATNLVSDDTNGQADVFLRDTKLNKTTILSNTDTGAPSNGYSGSPTISCDGAYVAFKSNATNLVTGNSNTNPSVYLVDRVSGNTIKDITPNANAGAGNSTAISCDGSTLLFASGASNLVSNDTNNASDVFAYQLQDETIERVNVSTDGQQNSSSTGPEIGISFNGKYVTFTSNASNLVTDDTNNTRDIFIRDIQARVTQRINMRSDGMQTTGHSDNPYITQDGRGVIYHSSDSGLVSGDTNGMDDVFMSKTGY